MNQLQGILAAECLPTVGRFQHVLTQRIRVMNRTLSFGKHCTSRLQRGNTKSDSQSRFCERYQAGEGKTKPFEDEFCNGCRKARTGKGTRSDVRVGGRSLVYKDIYGHHGAEKGLLGSKWCSPRQVKWHMPRNSHSDNGSQRTSFHTCVQNANYDDGKRDDPSSGTDFTEGEDEDKGDLITEIDLNKSVDENSPVDDKNYNQLKTGYVSLSHLTQESSVTNGMGRDDKEHGGGNGMLNCLDPRDYLLEPDIEKFLSEMGIEYEKGFTCHHIVCPKFGKLAMRMKKEQDKLLINSLSGYFQCNHCGTSGSWTHLRDNILYLRSKRTNRTRECFKDVDDVERVATESPQEVLRQMEGSQEFSALTEEQFETVLSIFDWHGLHRRTFTQYGVRCKIRDNKYSVIFPIQSTSGVVSAVRVYSGTVTDDGDIRLLPILTYPRVKEITDLFGWQKAPVGGTLVITVGEVNAMAVSQQTGTTALALRSITHLPQEVLPPLEQLTKIILWLGTDIKAWENTKTFAKKINDRRSYIFRPTMLKQMPLEVVQFQESVGQVLNEARLISHKAILTFSNLRQEVYSELAHHGQVSGIQWKKYTKLNNILKGHRRGELTILTGPTGSGKTTFMSDYSLDLCMQGVNTLWGSFEISNVRLVKIMLQQFAGKSIVKNLQDFDQIADEFSSLPMYFMTYFGQEQITRVLEAMSHAVYVHDISHVVVDNLQFMIGMDFSEHNRFLRQDNIVAQFRKFATEKNCHVTLIIHPRKVNEGEELSTASIFGSAKVSQESDNILLIQDQRLVRPSGRKYLQIAKNRFDGDLGVMVLTFSKDSLSFTLNEKKRNVRKTEDWKDEESVD